MRASEIASLCGLGGYTDVDTAFLELLRRTEPWRSQIPALERERGVHAMNPAEVIQEALPPPAVLEAAVKRAASATSAQDLQAVVNATVREAEPRIALAARGDEGMAVALRHAVASAVVMERGVVMEEEGLNRLGEELGCPVGERNSCCYTMLVCRGRVLVSGLVDGLLQQADGSVCIVELKTRKGSLPNPPPAHPKLRDSVQVRAYMELLSAGGRRVWGAKVRERFACGREVNHDVKRDEGLWKTIEGELERVWERFKGLTPGDVRELLRTSVGGQWGRSLASSADGWCTGPTESIPPETLVKRIVEMGFPQKEALEALSASKNDLGAAIARILSTAVIEVS